MGTKPSIRLFSSRYKSPLSLVNLTEIAASVYLREGINPVRTTHLICCSDYTIRKLNRIYRGKDKPTDVLSFVFDEMDLLGEIYISINRTKIQARRYGVAVSEEFARLFIHGLYHLAGYDHIKPADRRVMEPLESALRQRFFPAG